MTLARFAILVMLGGCLSEPGPPECGPPKPLTELNTVYDEYAPYLSSDRLEVLFHSNRDGANTNFTIYRATRASVDEPFDPPVAVLPLGMTYNLFDPVLTPDGKKLRYIKVTSGLGDGAMYQTAHDRTNTLVEGAELFPELSTGLSDGVAHFSFTDDDLAVVLTTYIGGSERLYMSARPSPSALFERAHALAFVSTKAAGGPWLSGNGQRLAYHEDDATGLSQLWSATRDGDDFANPVEIDVAHVSGTKDVFPFYHPGGRTLMFSSDRPGGTGGVDLWITCE